MDEDRSGSPLFEKDVGLQVMELLNRPQLPAWYNAASDTFCFQMRSDEPVQLNPAFDVTMGEGQTKHVYSLGADQWVWEVNEHAG